MAAIAFGAASGTAFAQDAVVAAVDPRAIAALDRMADHLQSLQQFRLTAETTVDDVVEGGILVETGGRTVYAVRRPDRLRIDMATDRAERSVTFDGETVTQFAPALGFYAVFDAPPTIAEMLDRAAADYGIELPLADLFFWGTERSNVGDLAEAFVVGDARIAGETCGHYAFRAETTDLQVWIRKHGDPLPCRLVIVTTDEEARPRYAATFEWDLDPLLGDALFTFAPPPGAVKIEQQAADATSTEEPNR